MKKGGLLSFFKKGKESKEKVEKIEVESYYKKALLKRFIPTIILGANATKTIVKIKSTGASMLSLKNK